MAERNQRGGLLGGQDPREPGRLQRVTFLHRAGADQAERLARHRNRPARDRFAAGDRLVADVDHLHAPARVDVRQPAPFSLPAFPALPARLPPPYSLITLSLREEERQAFERDRQVDAFQLHVRRHLQRPRRKIQHRLDAGGDDEAEHVLRRRRPARRSRRCGCLRASPLLQVVDVVDRHAAARLLADLLFSVSKSAVISNPSCRKPG